MATKKKPDTYWREVVAAAADVKSGAVTQFSPPGFSEAIGQPLWFFVSLGNLVLGHDGEWMWSERGESSEQRMKYAHKSAASALAALRAAVAPDEPACAEIIERVYGKG